MRDQMIISEILSEIKQKCDTETYNHLNSFITVKLNGYRLIKEEVGIVKYELSESEKWYKMFFISKKLQGLSERSLGMYKSELDRVLPAINKPIDNITTDDIRYYLACQQLKGTVSLTTLDNTRRYLNTFFQWLQDEEYILSNPVRKIKKIKQKKEVKSAFSFEEIEKLKLSCGTKREIAIIEVALSTGARADELVNIKLCDFNEKGNIKILGKGNKERIVYLNASAKVRLDDYLDSRKGNSEYLFSGEQQPYTKLQADRLRVIVKGIGEKAGVKDTHPHRFRRTCATVAYKRGMPIEEISKMLGHESIATTQIYIQVDDSDIKKSHEKYMN